MPAFNNQRKGGTGNYSTTLSKVNNLLKKEFSCVIIGVPLNSECKLVELLKESRKFPRIELNVPELFVKCLILLLRAEFKAPKD